MDVRLPDGTVIKNVPDNITKAQLTEKLQANGYDVSKLGGSSQPAQQPAGAPTAGERGAAALGGINRGIAGIAGLPVDTVENVLNLARAAYGSGATAFGRPDLAPDLQKGSFGGSEHIAGLLEKAGINTKNPRPDDPVSRGLHTGGMVAAGGGRRPVGPSVGAVVAQETLGPEWAGVGAMTPSAARQGAVAAGAAAKQSIADKARPNLETFKAAGAQPSAGQATKNTFLVGLENLAAKFPGGAGVFKKFIDKQQANIGSDAKTGVSAEDAGRQIESGTRNFVTRTKETWNRLDDQLAAKIPPDSRFTPSNTVRALDELTATVAGAEKTTAGLVNPKIAEIKANIAADMQANNGVMPYQALRAVRSKVGAMLDDSLVSGIPGGELKKLYGALSKDMETAAVQAGASKEFGRQNAFYRARMDRIETLEKVIGKTPEETFRNFMPKDADAATKVRQVMRSLNDGERKVVTEAVVNRLGRATPGKQDEVGEVFSSETFLTNWNKLSPAAKAQLFPDMGMRKNLDAIASVSANVRDNALFKNPSGTAGSFAAYSVYLSPLASVASGSLSPMIAAGSAAGAAYIGSRMLTSPRVVAWLAKAPQIKPEGQVAHLARLGVIYNSADDELRKELTEYIGRVSAK